MSTGFSALCLTLLLSGATSVDIQVECDLHPYQQRFPNIFSLDIFQRDESLVRITEGKDSQNLAPCRRVLTSSGTLTKDYGFLNATVDIACGSVKEIECELFGFRPDTAEYHKFRFKPKLIFNVGYNSPVMTRTPKKGTFAIGDVILFSCSKYISVNASTWRWTVQHTEQRTTKHTEFHPVPDGDYDVSTIVFSDCSYHTVSKYVLVPHKEGVVTIRCETGNGPVADSTIIIGRHDEHLSIHLFLTSFLVYGRFIILPSVLALWGDRISFRKPEHLSIHLFLTSFLVYGHFIILPSVLALLGDRISFRKPEHRRMRTFRTGISFLIAIIFLIWWVAVLSTVNQDMTSGQGVLSYWMFAAIEIIFILFYTITRFSANLSRCFEKKRQRYLYNARIAASYGAVMTPAVCWIMMKCYGERSPLWLEIIFWILTVVSFVGFVCVSKNREEKYWEIENKSQS